MYRLGRAAFTPLVGLIAAALLLTRFDFPFLAARGYIDIPYLAFVVWAAALEAERPRRGWPVLVLLALASLMRPEAWLLIGLYWLWIGWHAVVARSRHRRRRGRGRAADLGRDRHDRHRRPALLADHTSGLAEELGRAKGLSPVPHATWAFLMSLDKSPVLLAAVVGLLLALWLAPRRMLHAR